MALINTRAGINVGTELLLDEPNRTYELVEAGNLTAKDGVTRQAFYGKLVDLWSTTTYQDSPFPMNAIDALSGQYQIGIDAGGNANGWKPLNQTTRNFFRDGGAEEYDASGALLRIDVGVVGLGSINSGAQGYYQLNPNDAPVDFAFDDMPNIGVQVFGDANNGNFDKRGFLKAFVREQGKKFTDSALASTGAFKVNVLLSNEDDTRIKAADSEMTNAPYDNITVTYHASNQSRTIGGVAYNFNVIVEGNGATLEQIYTKLQFLLRQGSDIDSGAGTVIGKTADLLAGFVGSTLNTATGVFWDGILDVDSSRITFKDVTGVARQNPFESAGNLTFNPVMVQTGSSYRLMYTDAAGNADYGKAGAITVNDASGNPITGTITSEAISFTFDYDNDSAGGTAGTDKAYTLIGIAPGYSKFAVSTGTLTKSKVISAGLVAEVDRAYL